MIFPLGGNPGSGGVVPSSLDDLTDATVTATPQWPGPYEVTAGAGAPSAGTGNVGAFYIDVAPGPGVGVMYGPKQSDNTWPLVGTQNIAWVTSFTDPIDTVNGHTDGMYYFKYAFGPGGSIIPVGVWGPYTADGLNDRGYLGYNQTTGQWESAAGEFLLASEGGLSKAFVQNVSGSTTGIEPRSFSSFLLTLTGNTNLSAFAVPTPRYKNDTRASRITVAVKQGGSGSYTVTWPGNFKWPSGTAPTLSTTVGNVDIFEFISFDRGTTWLGFQVAAGIVS
jgi:hypothetical protein